MELAPFERWVKVNKEVEIKLGYLTEEQKYKLEEMFLECAEIKGEGKDTKFRISNPLKLLKFQNYTVRYQVKEWKGITIDGKPFECELDGDQISNETFKIMLNYSPLMSAFYKAIENSPLSFGDTDKKKSKSARS